jgi:GNAT superfamily N-acetyltransferase
MNPSAAAHRVQHDVCCALSSARALLLTVATVGDVSMVFGMVNTAYKVEDGDAGVAFKKTDRFLTHDEGDVSSRQTTSHSSIFAVLPSLAEGRVFLAASAVAPQEILGCIIWNIAETDDGAETVYFGPLAVVPDAQGKGVGSFLVDAVERLAAALHSAASPKVRSIR